MKNRIKVVIIPYWRVIFISPYSNVRLKGCYSLFLFFSPNTRNSYAQINYLLQVLKSTNQKYFSTTQPWNSLLEHILGNNTYQFIDWGICLVTPSRKNHPSVLKMMSPSTTIKKMCSVTLSGLSDHWAKRLAFKTVNSFSLQNCIGTRGSAGGQAVVPGSALPPGLVEQASLFQCLGMCPGCLI